jgi:rhamnosyltransferase
LTPDDRTPLVIAIIAAYRPEPALLENVRQTASQVAHVVVVNDGSPAGSESIFHQLETAGAVVLNQPANMGIAAALNAGIGYARKEWEADFFLTLDQDSLPTADYVRSALATFTRAQDAGLPVGFVAASSYSGHPIPVRGSERNFVNAFDPMQSGWLVPLSTLDRVGDFDEGLFIDGVDSDFTMRTRSAGLSVLVGEGCEIQHDLGQRLPGLLLGKPLTVLGREISYNYHSPARVYYICRNGTLLSHRYVRKDPAWVIRRLLEESKAHLLRFAFSRGRSKLLRAALAGFDDAVRGRLGRIPQKLEDKLRQ